METCAVELVELGEVRSKHESGGQQVCDPSGEKVRAVSSTETPDKDGGSIRAGMVVTNFGRCQESRTRRSRVGRGTGLPLEDRRLCKLRSRSFE